MVRLAVYCAVISVLAGFNWPITAYAEEIISIEVTRADFAAVPEHRRVHTRGAALPNGGRHPSHTLNTDSSHTTVELSTRASTIAPQAATTFPSGLIPGFSGPGFYPADLSLAANIGQTITKTQVHNIYVNCDASCFGYPAVFENRLFSSQFIHVLDQYVGSTQNDRYEVGPSLVIKNYSYTATLVTNPLVNYADLDAITHAAASKFGSGYGHIYHIFLPKSVDYCNGYSPPYTFCFSPDNISTWAECAEHDTDSFPDIPGTEYVTVEPYQDVFAIDSNGNPIYVCDVGQPYPFSTNTSPTPNGVLVDSVSDSVGHETFETITDPDGTEWQALNGLFGKNPVVEIGDVCELYYGTGVFTPFSISGHPYEIQPMYSNKYHACVTVP